MSDPDRTNAQNGTGGIGDLFDALPTPDPQPLTPAEPASAPAGSRRAAREARQTPAEGVEARPDESANRPGPTAQADAKPAEPSAASVAPADGSADHLTDLFAPEAHREPPKKRRRGRLTALIIVVVVLGGIAAGVAVVWNTFGDQIGGIFGGAEPTDYEPGQAEGESLVTIKSGDTGESVSTTLYQAGVTKTPEVFYRMLVNDGTAVTFYPGVYKMQKQMTAKAALAALQDESNRMNGSVSVPEGGTIEGSLPTIAETLGLPIEDLQAAVADPKKYGVDAQNLEGWLFPAVYDFDPGVTAEEVIARMVERTRQSLSEAGVKPGDEQRVLTIASIIQREARTEDFAKVSRVIQNRLDDGMLLQMDSTAQYGYGELNAGKVSTSQEAQHAENAWNTYVIEGLPATPIASPNDAAIGAAMNPADGPWRYFVTVNLETGETAFSATYEEHQQAIKRWDAWCKANPDGGC